MASQDQIAAINLALDSLATLGRNIPELKKAIAERLVLKHGYQGVQASDVPDHLTGEQAVKVANLLVLTLEKESKKAKK